MTVRERLSKRWRPSRLRVATYAVGQRCRGEDNLYLTWGQKQRYALKFLVCLALGREVENTHEFRFTPFGDYWVIVALYDFEHTSHFEFGDGQRWQEALVSRESWQIGFDTDGYP